MTNDWGHTVKKFRNDAPDCDCEGWWEQDYLGRQAMESLRIAFEGNRVQGSGIDIIGPFVLDGIIGEQGAVTILKQYIQRHCVDYLGQYDGEGTMSGEWRIGQSHGRWLIRLRRHSVDRTAEIVEWVPGS